MRNLGVEKEAEPPDFERLQVQRKATGEPFELKARTFSKTFAFVY